MAITRKHLLLVLAILCPHDAPAQEPVSQPQLQVNGVELSIGGRLQTQLNTTSIATEAPSQLFLRRARIEVGVRVNERVSGVVEPDFGDDEVELKDAYLQLDFSPAIQILAGRAYRPFGLLEQTSSKRILPIERGLRIRGLAAADEYAFTSGLGYSNRDVGLQVLGAPADAPLSLAYAAGIFRGPLHGAVGAQDTWQFAGRVTARPARLLRVGAGWSGRDFVTDDVDVPSLQRGHAYEIDLEYGSFAPGLHVLVEASRGDLDPASGATFQGVHGWFAYRTGVLDGANVSLEPIFRASHAETHGVTGSAPAGGTLLTPGLNIYFGPLNRFMINYDLWRGGGQTPDASSLKAMFQLAF